MLNAFKNWLCRKELAAAEQATVLAEYRKQEWAHRVRETTVTDLVREQLKGFNPRLLNDPNADIFALPEVEEIGRTEFLSQVHELAKNKALPIILDWLVREQVLYTAKEGRTLDEMNFGRATVNGLTLVQEERDRLEAIYAKEHEPEEDFDEHEVV